MLQKLTRLGDGWALVLDQPLLDQLRIAPETLLELTVDGPTLLVSPVRPTDRPAAFAAALEKVNRQYGRALKKLAE